SPVVVFGMIVTAYPSSDVTRDEFTRAGHEFTTSDLCGIDFHLRLSWCRSKHNRRKDKSGNDGRAAHEHAPFRGRAKTRLPSALWTLTFVTAQGRLTRPQCSTVSRFITGCCCQVCPKNSTHCQKITLHCHC